MTVPIIMARHVDWQSPGVTWAGRGAGVPKKDHNKPIDMSSIDSWCFESVGRLMFILLVEIGEVSVTKLCWI